jgi:hypothetical protein
MAGRGAVSVALVGREALWYGDLPPVCVKTGGPADGTVEVTFERLPPWTYLLLLAGIFPFFVALLLIRDQVRGQVPVTRLVVARYRAHRRPIAMGWALVALGVGLAAVAGEPWLVLLAGAGILLIVVAEVRRTQGWITGVPVAGTPFVELRRVHPAFAAAMAEQRDRARPTR